ncbi:energy transducer TonB [Aliarcobacter skirrowii]|uniref:Energy transducer TonB n=1 Tax=Aliarcobacter skirrowii TaxID=28200 RepID=A0A2U2C039_9BACT|nr:energy transducer TonB [Aliarcobacter skirrowii]MDX4012874.1 energy transducer TonB [Aliarcobacter skirrowii]MDX4037526.1 energy transducer TonB [Aliarcobacter skirrowii]PWE20515.1 energy transducer TonB [Aliarcobacter skirrowii]PWE21105.1 energy transducer TonB [Aliarcobacter skirrowii]PWE24757.1 energy transducer TonB [Aliarcobacter skirrowii]
MKRIYIAFLISILIHLSFFIILNYSKLFEKKEVKDNQKPHSTSEIKFVKLAPKESFEESKQTPKIEPIPNPIKEKKEETIIKPKPKEQKEKEFKKDLQEAKSFQEKILKESSKLQEQTLENFLSQKDTIYNSEVFNELKELYGKEYDNFTTVQKAYLEKNINNFQIITQRVLNRLGYPHEAVRLKITGINIVEFIFHPNGDISDLRIIQSSGYSILDNRTLELIQIAYKEYPKPQTPTLLRFKVFYRLY